MREMKTLQQPSSKRFIYTLMGFIVSWCIFAGVIGCEVSAVATVKTNNPNMKVDFLFEHEGCRVYRFSDNGNDHYYAKCANGSFTSSEIPQGKTTRPEEIPTGETN